MLKFYWHQKLCHVAQSDTVAQVYEHFNQTINVNIKNRESKLFWHLRFHYIEIEIECERVRASARRMLLNLLNASRRPNVNNHKRNNLTKKTTVLNRNAMHAIPFREWEREMNQMNAHCSCHKQKYEQFLHKIIKTNWAVQTSPIIRSDSLSVFLLDFFDCSLKNIFKETNASHAAAACIAS